jgi:hypothetical protein
MPYAFDFFVGLLFIVASLFIPVAINRIRESRAKQRRRADDSDESTILKRGTRSIQTSRTRKCFEALGLDSSATAEEVIASYRRLALSRHPDRGGDPDDFKRLHRDFEQALAFAEGRLLNIP